MKKNFIYLFIINIMLMIISFILMTIYQYNNKSSLLAIIIPLSVLLIIFIVLLISQASINISKETDIKKSEKIITLTIVTIFGIVILLLISYAISQMLFVKKASLMIGDANKLISSVERESKDNYVFMLDSIKLNNISTSSFGNKYKNNSYVTTFNKTSDICLTDGKYSVIKNINTKELELIKGDTCNLELEENKASLYIKERLFERYNVDFGVYNCKRNNDYDSIFNNKTGLTCEIKYNNKNYSATLYDNKLELTDSYVGGYDEK